MANIEKRNSKSNGSKNNILSRTDEEDQDIPSEEDTASEDKADRCAMSENERAEDEESNKKRR